jgi:hypothetical protein
MSAGHPHRGPNERHAIELESLRRDPAVARRMAQRFGVDTAHDIADLAGYSVDGATIHVDRHLAAALAAGRIRLPGRSPQQSARIVLRALVTHEHTEKSLIDAKHFSYPAAHEFATLAEHQVVRAAGISPHAYEAALRPFIKRAAVERIQDPPSALDCTPYIDDPDANDRRVLAAYHWLGVRDAARGAEHDKNLANRGPHHGDQDQAGPPWQAAPRS